MSFYILFLSNQYVTIYLQLSVALTIHFLRNQKRTDRHNCIWQKVLNVYVKLVKKTGLHLKFYTLILK